MHDEGFLGPQRRHLRGSAFVVAMISVGAAACGSSATAVTAQNDASPSDDAPDVATDAITADAGGLDAEAVTDTAAPPRPLPPPSPQPYGRPSYQRLSETGLYADVASRDLSDGLLLFEPTHKLWSDGAEKRRWVALPPGTQIDSHQMDHWMFPIGTKLWKEFSRDGVLLETRLIERYGTGSEDYWMGAFVWTADQADAIFAIDGASNINGTEHDAPAQKNCGACHRGDPGRVLGLSAIQMSRQYNPTLGPTLGDLASAGLLSDPPPVGIDYPVPGDQATAAALGYMHANCGHCHNENGTSWPDTQMVMRLRVDERDLSTCQLYTSVVGKKLQYWRGGAITLRVAPRDPDGSAVTARMHIRGSKDQMPPLATEVVDLDGFALVRDWINTLP